MRLSSDPQAFSKLNERNNQFWAIQSQLTAERMSDEVLCRFGLETMHSERMRGIPFKLHQSIDTILNDAAAFKEAAHKMFSQKGGRVSKPDALQRVIVKIVSSNPIITLRQLLKELMEKRWAKLNIEIDSDIDVLADEKKEITFDDVDGERKVASLSGLKDRLYRAKKSLASAR
jgi:hypothetical protein